MIISTAFAQTAEQAQTLPDIGGMRVIVQLVLIFVIFYFLLIRPQQKRAKLREQMLHAIGKGNKVIFGGIEGTVVKVLNDSELLVEIAQGVEVKVLRTFVAEVIVASEKKKEKEK